MLHSFCLSSGVYSKVHLMITIFLVYKGLIAATVQVRPGARKTEAETYK